MAGLLGMKSAASFASKYKSKINPLQPTSLKGRQIVHDNHQARTNGKAMYWDIGRINGMLKQWQDQSRWSYKKKLDQANTFVRKLPGVEIVPCKEERVFYLANSTFGEDHDLEERDLQGDFSFTLEDPSKPRKAQPDTVHVVSSSDEEGQVEEKREEPGPAKVAEIDPVTEPKGQ